MSRYLYTEIAYLVHGSSYRRALKNGLTRGITCDIVYFDQFVKELTLPNPSVQLQSYRRNEISKVHSQLVERHLVESHGALTNCENDVNPNYYLRIYCEIVPLDTKRGVGAFKNEEGFWDDFKKYLEKQCD